MTTSSLVKILGVKLEPRTVVGKLALLLACLPVLIAGSRRRRVIKTVYRILAAEAEVVANVNVSAQKGLRKWRQAR